MRVTISGLTGSGKTTVGIGLSKALGIKYLSGSALRADWLGLDPGKEPVDRRLYWSRNVDAIRADRSRMVSSEEQEFDRWTVSKLRATDSGVFDVWFLPWFLKDGDAIRIWLDVPRKIRVRRIVDERIDVKAADGADASCLDHEAERDLDDKDERNRSYALHAYDIDIEKHVDVFEMRVAVNGLLSSNDLIALIHAVLTKGIDDAVALTTRSRLGSIIELSGPLVTRS